MRFVTPLLLTLLASCQTTDREPVASDVQGAPTPAAASDADDDDALKVGLVADEDLRRSIHKALDAQISKKQALDEDGEQTTEIGDLSDFKFTITRLAKGKEEVTGSEIPDTADVEATGWYRVTVKSNDPSDGKPTCTSFDASLTLIKTGGAWRMPEPAVIGREDGEDCF